jgi:hypothetical protein
MKVTIEFDHGVRLMDFNETIKFLFGLGISCHFSDRFEDAGCGMYNLHLPLGIVLQCYPFGTEQTYLHVYDCSCDETDDLQIDDFPLIIQKNIIAELADAVHGDLKKNLSFTDDGLVSFDKVTYTIYTSTLKDIIDFVNANEIMFKRLDVEF